MLTELTIHNFLVVEKIHLHFSSGTTVISGETGAGKSVLIGALAVVLGDRASTKLVGSYADKADICAVFNLENAQDAQEYLRTHDYDDTHCIIRKTIRKDGRSRGYINGIPATIADIQQILAPKTKGAQYIAPPV